MPLDIPQRFADLDLSVPHLDEYFGLWSIREDSFRAAVERINRLDLRLHVERTQAGLAVEEPRSAADRYGYDVAPGGVAVINLTGPLMKYQSSLSGGTSTAIARRALRNAVNDEAVRAIVLRIDSPGGTTSGTADLADDVARAAKAKPTVAYIEDTGASAAYWIASQARKVYANRTAIVGSIGTYTVLYDASAAADKEGIKVHVIRTGEHKGVGVMGAEITPEQLAAFQEMVDDLNEHFVRGVAAGRKLTLAAARDLADGDVYVGEAAVAAGLVDAIQSLDETISQLQPKPRSAKAMSADNPTPETVATIVAAKITESPAAYHDLVEACAGADAEFLCGQLKVKATVDQAQKAWMTEQGARLAAAQKEATEAKQAAAAAAKKPGTAPLVDAAADADQAEPLSEFESLVEAEITKLGARYPEHGGRGRMPRRAKAVSNVAARRPDLHRAVVAAANKHLDKHLPRVFESA